MVDCCLAGTGGMMPLPTRSLTCFWLEYQGRAALIDCGEGTQVALERCDLKLSRLELILITHTHGDHILGLPGLLLTLSNCGKTTPLTICGPKGMMHVINGICCVCPMFQFPVEVIEFTEEQNTVSWNEFTVDILKLRHTMPCLGYRFTLHRRPIFDPHKATENNIPQEYWQKLHRGETVTDGERTFTQQDVTCGERNPLIVSYMTDTVCFDEMADFAKNSDLLICEGMYGDLDNVDKMMARGHTVFAQAAELAVKANAKRLWLTHYSPALTDPQKYQRSLCEIFEGAVVCEDGQKVSIR